MSKFWHSLIGLVLSELNWRVKIKPTHQFFEHLSQVTLIFLYKWLYWRAFLIQMIFLGKNSSRIKTVAQMLINFIFQWWKNLAQNTICAHSRHIANQIMQSSLFVQYLLRLTAVFVIKNRKRPECTIRFLSSEKLLIIIRLYFCFTDENSAKSESEIFSCICFKF